MVEASDAGAEAAAADGPAPPTEQQRGKKARAAATFFPEDDNSLQMSRITALACTRGVHTYIDATQNLTPPSSLPFRNHRAQFRPGPAPERVGAAARDRGDAADLSVQRRFLRAGDALPAQGVGAGGGKRGRGGRGGKIME